MNIHPIQKRGIIGTGKKGNQPGQFNYPHGVCYDEKNQRILVTDGGNCRHPII